LQAVIFDVDGTLADTERDGHRVAFNTAFHEAGLDWEWDVALYGELLVVTGGKERMRAYAEKYRYSWVLERLKLSAGAALAIEDSRNGVRSALGAGLTVVVTPSTYTMGEDFTGAIAVVSDLGEPGRPFTLLQGVTPARRWVDAEALIHWAASASGHSPNLPSDRHWPVTVT
jgi:beta-phosphoglucomutase-like phosphatase (HAD superfamily)